MLKNVVLKREKNTRKSKELISPEIKFALIRLLEKELEIQRKLSYEISNIPQSGIYEIFKKISGDKINYIYPEKVADFLEKYQILFNKQDIEAIFKRLDKDGDGKISYLEFLDNFMPISSGENQEIRRETTETAPQMDNEKNYEIKREEPQEPQEAEEAQNEENNENIKEIPEKRYSEENEDRPLQIPQGIFRNENTEIGIQAVPQRENIEIQKESDSPKINDENKFSTPIKEKSENEIKIKDENIEKNELDKKRYSPDKESEPTKPDTSIKSPIEKESKPISVRDLQSPVLLSPNIESKPLEESPFIQNQNEEQKIMPQNTENMYVTPIRSQSPNNAQKSIFYASGTTMPSTAQKSKNLIYEEPTEIIDEKRLEEELVWIFKNQLKIDNELEKEKIKLWTRSDFNILDLFRFFDSDGLSIITLFECKNALDILGVNYNENALFLLMKRYDQDYDGKLCLAEFERMLKPADKLISKNMPKPYPSASRGELILSKTTIEIFRNLLVKMLEGEQEAEYIRRQAVEKQKTGVFNYKNAYKTLDKVEKGYIWIDDVF